MVYGARVFRNWLARTRPGHRPLPQHPKGSQVESGAARQATGPLSKHLHPPASAPPPPLTFRGFADNLTARLVHHKSRFAKPAVRLQRIVSRLSAPRDPAAKTRLYYLLRRLKRARSLSHSRLLLQTLLDRRTSLGSADQPPGALPAEPLMNIARDVIVCRGDDGALHCTGFYVSFKPLSTLYKWFMGRPRVARRPVVAATTTNPSDTHVAQDLSSQLSASLTLAAAPPPPDTDPDPSDKATGAPDSTEGAPAHDASSAPSSLRGASSLPPSAVEREREEEWVDVLVNNKPVPQLRMSVGPGGLCYFKQCEGGRRDLPTSEALAHMPLHPGRNDIEFVYRTPFGDLRTRAWVHLWGAHDRVVVSDIDGTMTRSDVIGYIDTVQLRKYDYTHAGICRLYSHLAATHEVRFVYLTSRPISMLEPTRAYIEGCRQEGQALPPGPIFTSTGTLTQTLYKELIEKTIRYFKAHVLMDISDTFTRAGRASDNATFHLGFGNKKADGEAYSAAGLHPNNIFIIDHYSEIRVFGHDADGLGAGGGDPYYEREEGVVSAPPMFATYGDEKLLHLITHRLQAPTAVGQEDGREEEEEREGVGSSVGKGKVETSNFEDCDSLNRGTIGSPPEI